MGMYIWNTKIIYLLISNVVNELITRDNITILNTVVGVTSLIVGLIAIKVTLSIKETQDYNELQRERPIYDIERSKEEYKGVNLKRLIWGMIGEISKVKKPSIEMYDYRMYGDKEVNIIHLLWVDEEKFRFEIENINKTFQWLNMAYSGEEVSFKDLGSISRYGINKTGYGNMGKACKDLKNNGKPYKIDIPNNFRIVWWITSMYGIGTKIEEGNEKLKNKEKQDKIFKEASEVLGKLEIILGYMREDKYKVDDLKEEYDKELENFDKLMGGIKSRFEKLNKDEYGKRDFEEIMEESIGTIVIKAIETLERVNKVYRTYTIVEYKDINGRYRYDVFKIDGDYGMKVTEEGYTGELNISTSKEMEFIGYKELKRFEMELEKTGKVYLGENN